MRACGVALENRFPDPIGPWLLAADRFDHGQLDEQDLEEVRVSAWRYHDARRSEARTEELSALRVAMCSLWPSQSPSDWDITLDHFIHFCAEADLDRIIILALLKTNFPEAFVDSDQ